MGFLCRAVLRTELAGEGWAERAGAATLLTSTGLWLGVWDAALAGDPEALIRDAQATAEDGGTRLAGAVVLHEQPGAGTALSELGDALYVYGYPQAGGWPDSIQVLGKPSWPKPRRSLMIQEAGSAVDWPVDAPEPGAGNDGIAGACLAAIGSPPARRLIAFEQDQPIGAAQLLQDSPVARLTYIWVAEVHRKHGVGAGLLEQAAKSAQAAGCIALSVWTCESGLLRYYFPRFGFAQQLSAKWFLPQR